LLEAQEGAQGIPDRDLCFVADIRLGEHIGPADDHARRLRDIRAACRTISTLWPSIHPRPSKMKEAANWGGLTVLAVLSRGHRSHRRADNSLSRRYPI